MPLPHSKKVSEQAEQVETGTPHARCGDAKFTLVTL